jgi:predicted enzyme related to lactoylglutathione lyase
MDDIDRRRRPTVAGIHIERPLMMDIPTSRPVPDLDAALALIGSAGGSIASETRTAPGIGSWAFVVDREGREIVLWETAAALR